MDSEWYFYTFFIFSQVFTQIKYDIFFLRNEFHKILKDSSIVKLVHSPRGVRPSTAQRQPGGNGAHCVHRPCPPAPGPTPAQPVRVAEAPQLQAVGGPRRQRAAGGDGVAPALPAAQVRRRTGAQQQALRVGLRGLLEESTELLEAGGAPAVGPRGAGLPIGHAQPVTLVIKSAQHGELQAEVRVCGKSGTKSPVLLQTQLP